MYTIQEKKNLFQGSDLLLHKIQMYMYLGVNNNKAYYYIMILFKQFYWLSCCHLTFPKI